jgi:hypothetical protein
MLAIPMGPEHTEQLFDVSSQNQKRELDTHIHGTSRSSNVIA